MVSAELVVKTKQTSIFDTAITVKEESCSVENSALQGCYRCLKGAEAKIKCRSRLEIFGEIICNHKAFVVPCAPYAPESTLRFHFNYARQLVNCSINCGKLPQYFMLVGVLKYMGNLHALLREALKENSTHYNEIKWPDFAHIVNVIFSWYKTLILTVLGIMLLLFGLYICLQAVGTHILRVLLRFISKMLCLPYRTMIPFPRLLQRAAHRQSSLPTHTHEKIF